MYQFPPKINKVFLILNVCTWHQCRQCSNEYLYLVSQDLYLFIQLVDQRLRRVVWQWALFRLQLFLEATDVVLSKPDDHSARVDELVFLRPGLLQLRHFLQQNLSVGNHYCKFPVPTVFPYTSILYPNKWQKKWSHTRFSSSRFLHRRTEAINFALYEASSWISMDGPDEKSRITLLQHTRKHCLITCTSACNTVTWIIYYIYWFVAFSACANGLKEDVIECF